jgi:hypothetical protein
MEIATLYGVSLLRCLQRTWLCSPSPSRRIVVCAHTYTICPVLCNRCHGKVTGVPRPLPHDRRRLRCAFLIASSPSRSSVCHVKKVTAHQRRRHSPLQCTLRDLFSRNIGSQWLAQSTWFGISGSLLPFGVPIQPTMSEDVAVGSSRTAPSRLNISLLQSAFTVKSWSSHGQADTTPMLV